LFISREHLMKFIDLFCGIGGFHIALSRLGHKCVFACDIDDDCRSVYEANHGIKPEGDIRKVDETLLPDFDILCAGPPCQAFSHSGKQRGFEDETRGTLFFDIFRILKYKQPTYFIIENVRNLYGHDKGNTWNTIHRNLIKLGYITYDKPIIMNPLHLGIPQNRDRVFIIGVLKGQGVLKEYPTYKKKATDLNSILQKDGEISKETLNKVKIKEDVIIVLEKWEELIQHFKEKEDRRLPGFPLWTDYWDGFSKTIPGGDGEEDMPKWKQNFITKNRQFYNQNISYLSQWLKEARKISKFTGSMKKLEWQCGDFKPTDSIWNLIFQFRPSGIRIKRSEYSPALVAMTQIVHLGNKKRKLTPREVARLQSFPEDFKIHSKDAKAYKQFGNAVNVKVVEHIAKFLLSKQVSI
jgi:DNA (cytosine-5)-methyltransferase 1